MATKVTVVVTIAIVVTVVAVVAAVDFHRASLSRRRFI